MITYIIPFLSIILGLVIALVINPKDKKLLKLLLAFSGAFLLTMTVTHLLPEVYATLFESNVGHDHHNHHEHDHHAHHDHGAMKYVGIIIMLGIVFQIILEYFSKGAEHGHVHRHHKMNHIPWSLFISLCLHALLEGMPISQHEPLAWAIGVHHFPIAIILTLFFKQAQMQLKQLILFMLLFAAMTPLGTYLAGSLSFLKNYYLEISAFVIGILFHISSTIIFESSEGHKFNAAKLFAIILGIVAGYFL